MSDYHPDYDMLHVNEGRGLALLRLSALGFVALTGGLGLGYFLLLQVFGSSARLMWSSDLRILALDMVAPVLPVSAVSWWLLVVRPRRSSASAGGCAGLLTSILAIPSVVVVGLVVAFVTRTPGLPTGWQIIEAVLTFWLLGFAYICTQPWGWGMVLLGVSTGAVYGELVRRRTVPVQDGELTAEM